MFHTPSYPRSLIIIAIMVADWTCITHKDKFIMNDLRPYTMNHARKEVILAGGDRLTGDKVHLSNLSKTRYDGR